jgi:hypothetical protein
MITMNAARLTREEIEHNVRRMCSRYGRVQHVLVVASKRATFAIAGVEMASLAETWEIARRFGETLSDATAVIRIE